MMQHILVVDDEEIISGMISTYFKRKGYEVSTASNAREAEKLLEEVQVNLVLLDIEIGDDDGLELLERIKAAHPSLPVLMLTGLGYDEDLLQTAVHGGASGYISKTLPLDQVYLEIKRLLTPPPAASNAA